ncbi:MAG: hypothetical protein P8L32_04345 [Paracoccaceae bacterium]|nr:hypothetical protein [Paracoccaceae bacterium]
MKKLVTAAALALSLGASAATAQEMEYWGSAGGWDVMIDPSLG